MAVEPLACPYCNALMPLPSNARDGQRVTCPRCGESFPLRGVGVQSAPGVTPTPAALPPVSSLPATRGRNRLVAGLVLATMVLMAAAGLTFALRTQAERRANDAGLKQSKHRSLFPEASDDAPTALVAPAKWPALAYLPPHTNLLLGIHVRRLRESAAGRKLLTEPLTTGRGEVDLRNLFRWTGLEIEELDHLVVGVRTEDIDFPRVVVVARTWKPIDRSRVRSTLNAVERHGPRKDQMVYRFQIPNTPIRPTLWFTDDPTLMVFDLLGSMDDVPAEPFADIDHLPFPVRDALTTRVDPGAVVWLVGAISDGKKTVNAPWFQAVQSFVGLGSEGLARLQALRVLAVSALLEPTARAQADFRCADMAAARALRMAIVGPDDVPQPGVRAELANDWLTVQWQGGLDRVFKSLAK